MGEVYLADDTRLQRRVAIKLLNHDALADQRARDRLLREARAAAGLDHPAICTVYEVGEADGRAFIAMQYVEGEALGDRLKRLRFPSETVLSIASDLAGGLSAAHEHRLIHRDIKPQNIIIASSGRAKILDFGLAKAAAVLPDETTVGSITVPGGIAGTIAYMSPEQARGEALDARTDIFSFGIMLYEMLTG